MKRNKRKEREGVVISNKMAKTVTVKVVRMLKHPVYEKPIKQYKKYYAHDESDKIEVGQQVKIMECRPFSKIKRWRVVKTL